MSFKKGVEWEYVLDDGEKVEMSVPEPEEAP
jgi:hypothetical protein